MMITVNLRHFEHGSNELKEKIFLLKANKDLIRDSSRDKEFVERIQSDFDLIKIAYESVKTSIAQINLNPIKHKKIKFS